MGLRSAAVEPSRGVAQRAGRTASDHWLQAAYIFKRRYMESMAAERAMSGAAASIFNLRVTGGAYRAINYDSDWWSGSDVSDAFEEVEVTGTRTLNSN